MPYSDTSVRVENATDVVFDSVTVGGFDHRGDNYQDYGRLDPHTSSTYRRFDRAYSYGHIRVQTGGRPLDLRPVDYVGEDPLAGGRYTYRLTIATAFNGRPQLNLEFVTDRSLKKDLGRILKVFLAIVIALALFVRFVLVPARERHRLRRIHTG
jgi:hypothetical protein